MAVTIKRVGYSPASIGGGGGSTQASRYIDSFTVSDWSLSGDDYIITVPVSSHNKGTNPQVTVYLNNMVTYEEVEVSVKVNASGDVVLAVTVVPDNRFQGKVVII